MSKAAMDKRKPKHASANFWGGKSTSYKNGKKVEAELEGWQDEMYRKTLVREVFSSKYITRDPSKIDDNYQYMREREIIYALEETEHDALEYGSKTPVDIPSEQPEETEDGEVPQQTQDNTPKGYTPPDI